MNWILEENGSIGKYVFGVEEEIAVCVLKDR